METQSTPIRIPDSSRLYIFGSALISLYPNDLDVLVIYDPLACSPREAYHAHREMVLDLENLFSLPVHLTLLTPTEESGTDFIQRTGALDFARLWPAFKTVQSHIALERGSGGHGRTLTPTNQQQQYPHVEQALLAAVPE